MNLLMITRIVDRNDSHAGHTYRWVQEIGTQLAPGQLSVLCLERGDISGLPPNVTVHSLGKERGGSRMGRWFRFPFAVWPRLAKSDAVFCHQNPEYTMAVWPLAKLRCKRIVAWYVHGSVTWKTRMVARISDAILTASPESFRIASPKVQIVGHGIDTQVFCPPVSRSQRQEFTIVSIGRISPTKDYETLIKAVAELRRGGEAVSAQIIGEPGLPEHRAYLESLQMMVQKLGLENAVKFLGPIPNRAVATYYQQADLMVNLSGTGSLDKAVLEAMACGILVITSNEAFKAMLPAQYVIVGNNHQVLAAAIVQMMVLSVEQRCALGSQLRDNVVRQHKLKDLVTKIISACSVGKG